jgi:L-rhamnono-1,4-lactonase
MASDQEDQLIVPIIDSHVHIFKESHLDTIGWSRPDGPLRGKHSIEQYKAAAKSAPSLLGAIFVEADRTSHVNDETGWTHALDELDFLSRLARGEPSSENDDDGFSKEDAKLCLAIVPWAPVAAGPAVLEAYLARAAEVAGEAWLKVKGFRYLLQDKPDGTMLKQEFVDAVRLLGRKRFRFEIGVDNHRRGKKQLDEVAELLERVHEGVPDEEKTVFILGEQPIHLLVPSFFNPL